MSGRDGLQWKQQSHLLPNGIRLPPRPKVCRDLGLVHGSQGLHYALTNRCESHGSIITTATRERTEAELRLNLARRVDETDVLRELASECRVRGYRLTRGILL